MSTAIVMPQLGLTMAEGTISVWLKQPGDAVKKDEPLFTVSTDKVEMDVESTGTGTLGAILIPAGQTVPVGTVLAYLAGSAEPAGTSGGEQPLAKPMVEAQAPAPNELPKPMAAPVLAHANPSARARGVSPRAKRLAKELGLDAAAVRGSGSEGHVTENDVRAAAASVTPRSGGNHRQLIAERLLLSVRTIPTFCVAAEANAERLLELQQTLKDSQAPASPKSTLTDLLLLAFARTLKRISALNATWVNNTVRTHATVDIGLAVATANGVIAPVLRNVDTLGLPALVARRIELIERSRSASLSLVDLEGGVATLSNLGKYRVDNFQAIISPGQSSILAVGQVRQRPWFDKTLTVKPTVVLNLTVDHRVADGAAAGEFLEYLVELVENPQDLCNESATSASRGAAPRSRA